MELSLHVSLQSRSLIESHIAFPKRQQDWSRMTTRTFDVRRITIDISIYVLLAGETGLLNTCRIHYCAQISCMMTVVNHVAFSSKGSIEFCSNYMKAQSEIITITTYLHGVVLTW